MMQNMSNIFKFVSYFVYLRTFLTSGSKIITIKDFLTNV